MSREELFKLTVKELKAYYEELTGSPYDKSIKRKEDIVDAIKSHIRARQRGAAFKNMM